VKNSREESNTQRKVQDGSAPTMQASANKADVIRKSGEKKKVRPGKLTHSVSAGQGK
jgi:hypothetical protein